MARVGRGTTAEARVVAECARPVGARAADGRLRGGATWRWRVAAHGGGAHLPLVAGAALGGDLTRLTTLVDRALEHALLACLGAEATLRWRRGGTEGRRGRIAGAAVMSDVPSAADAGRGADVGHATARAVRVLASQRASAARGAGRGQRGRARGGVTAVPGYAAAAAGCRRGGGQGDGDDERGTRGLATDHGAALCNHRARVAPAIGRAIREGAR